MNGDNPSPNRPLVTVVYALITDR
ncbi:hypothetical protein [Shigella sonnei]